MRKGRNYGYNATQVIIVLREICEERGRRVTAADFRKKDWDGPSMREVTKYFGSFSNAMAIVDYRTPEEEEKRMQREIHNFVNNLLAV